jgi:hypothetical protein
MNLMERLRLIVLSVLFAGSASIVFAAITLVKAGELQGIPVQQSAAANAPIFLQFSNVVLTASLILIVCEWGHYRRTKDPARVSYARYAASFVCFICTLLFSLVIVPNMERVLPAIHQDKAAFLEFTKLHHLSRMVFGGTVLFALVSLVLTDVVTTGKGVACKTKAS